MTGAMLGQFRLLERLGQGGMGEVWLADDTALGRRVAVKRLLATTDQDPQWTARLRREAKALAAVNHPNVVTVHAVGEADGSPFVVMELVAGGTLADLLPAGGFPIDRLLELATGIAGALDAAHATGVVHRDLKPANVMLAADGRVKVVDFGLARLAAGADDPSRASTAVTEGLLMGTLAYMAPEQLAGEHGDRKSDLYALGVTLFEMATGGLPFTGTTMPWLMRQILLEPAPLLSERRADAPERLVRLVASLLAKEPSARPGSARLVLDELERCRRNEPPAPRPASPRTTGQVARRSVAFASAADVEIAKLLIRGRHLWNRRTYDSLGAALACFQEVIDRDPTRGAAWIGIADTLNMLANYGFAPSGDSAARVRAAVARAVDLDGETGDALRALALARWQGEFDWEGAEALYHRALALEPDNALTHYWYGVMLAVVGRWSECRAQLLEAEALDPLSLIALAARGWFEVRAGEPAPGHAILRRVLGLDPNYFPAWWFDGEALAALGRADEAVAAFDRAIELGGRSSRMVAYRGWAAGRAARTADARAALEELRARGREDYVPDYFPALVHAGLGEREAALEALERAGERRDAMLRDLAADTAWREYREEPRFRALLDRLGLAGRTHGG